MELEIDEARSLSLRALVATGLPTDSAEIVTDHLIDAHCCGQTFAGLPRLLVMLDRVRQVPEEDLGRTELTRETESSALLDGRGNLGYITCQRAIEVGIRKAETSPIVLVGAFNSRYSGRLGYYTEQAARQGLIALHVTAAAPSVAAAGGTRPILGTNPICVALPTSDCPVICDLTTAATAMGELDLAARTGSALAEGLAIDSAGKPTTDPVAALEGAILPWGGHKGYALALAVAGLSILAGGEAVPGSFGSWGYLFIVIRGDAFLSMDEFIRRMDELVRRVRKSSDDIRIPGERSAAARERALASGRINVPRAVVEALRAEVG